MAVIGLTPDLSVDERLLSFSMVQSGGPGGQNVNKVATAVLLGSSTETPGRDPERCDPRTGGSDPDQSTENAERRRRSFHPAG